MVFGWNYLFTFIATAGIYAKFTSWVNNKRVPELKLAKQMDKKADNILSESLANFYTIKHFNQENFEIKKYDNVLQVNSKIIKEIHWIHIEELKQFGFIEFRSAFYFYWRNDIEFTLSRKISVKGIVDSRRFSIFTITDALSNKKNYFR
jgi:hypothetical protein